MRGVILERSALLEEVTFAKGRKRQVQRPWGRNELGALEPWTEGQCGWSWGSRGRGGETSHEKPARAWPCKARRVPERTVDFSVRVVDPCRVISRGGTGLIAF